MVGRKDTVLGEQEIAHFLALIQIAHHYSNNVRLTGCYGHEAWRVIPAHLHRGMAEALYAVEGDFTNEGEQYSQALRCTFKAGREHRPHATNKR